MIGAFIGGMFVGLMFSCFCTVIYISKLIYLESNVLLVLNFAESKRIVF